MNSRLKFRLWDGKRFWLDGFILEPTTGQPWLFGEWGNFQKVDGTVQQFTGLKDMDGKDIFEGDIVKKYWATKNHDGEMVYTDNGFCTYPVKWHQKQCCFDIAGGRAHDYKVVGNIFDDKI